MNLPKVYIDGQVGTTGLKISEILAARKDIQVYRIPEQFRKNEAARRDAVNEADLVILCLPDDAAVQAANWAAESATKVIDASTAHRVDENWVYGLPEAGSQFRESIRKAQFVANPGCYPTSVILLLRPLIQARLIRTDIPIILHALSGYSGGGKKLIERWESKVQELKTLPFSAPYALQHVHKHIPEMMRYAGLDSEPQFLPRVGPFAQGMRVEIPIHASNLEQTNGAAISDLYTFLQTHYAAEKFIRVMSSQWTGELEFQFDPMSCNGTNRVDLHVVEHPSGHVLLVGILDNLGKGASGAAVQSLNLMLGYDEVTGLKIQ